MAQTAGTPKPGMLKLRLPMEKQNLSNIRKTVSYVLKDSGFSHDKISGIEVSIVEHCENIIKYAYAGRTGYIDVEVEAKLPVAKVKIIDNARAFNMLKAELPSISERIKKGVGGKMGIRTILSMCDKVVYKRTGNKNENTFIIRENGKR
jgi:anti-sigma regulatory factor (Ser/Thr protein kinase)